MSRVATRGRRARSNAAGRERTPTLILGVLAVIALISLKISSGVTGAGLLWNRSPGHPPAGMGGPGSPLFSSGCYEPIAPERALTFSEMSPVGAGRIAASPAVLPGLL